MSRCICYVILPDTQATKPSPRKHLYSIINVKSNIYRVGHIEHNMHDILSTCLPRYVPAKGIYLHDNARTDAHATWRSCSASFTILH